jgi:hypothetical protein
MMPEIPCPELYLSTHVGHQQELHPVVFLISNRKDTVIQEVLLKELIN